MVHHEFIWIVAGKENTKMKRLVMGLYIFFTFKNILPYYPAHKYWWMQRVHNAFGFHPVIFFLFLCLFIYFERESWGGAERERERERESQAGSMLLAQSLTWVSNSQTMRSWPEPRSGVRCLTDWATQLPYPVIS